MGINCNWFKIFLKWNKISYGKSLLLKGVPFIYRCPGSEVSMGEGCVVKSSFFSNLVGLYSRTVIVTRREGACIRIGDHVGISGATIYARKGVIIGDNTVVGGNAKILDNDFHPLGADERNRLMRDPHGGDSALVQGKEISIGRDCFIGCNSIILKGSEIGDRCIVGAGAVVSGKFEADSVIVGNPARTIRKLDCPEEKNPDEAATG